MSVVISDELQELFDLREHASKLRERVSAAQAKCNSNMQQNTGKEFVDVHDLDVAYKLLKSVNDCKHEFDLNEQQYQQKKRFFINLLKSSGSSKLLCTNKEWDADGNFHYVPYVLSVVEDGTGQTDLQIEPEPEYNMAEKS